MRQPLVCSTIVLLAICLGACHANRSPGTAAKSVRDGGASSITGQGKNGAGGTTANNTPSSTGTTCASDETRCGKRCVVVASDPANCGACGQACSAGEACDGSGHCVTSCPSYLIECAGACIDPTQDRRYCGASGDCSRNKIGTRCAAGEVCAAGACSLSCQAGFVRCGDHCVNPREDNAHCGASADCSGDHAGTACPSGSVCSDGRCALACQQGLLDCGGHCIDPLSDRKFCGASGDCAGSADDGGSDGTYGEACALGEVCSDGRCAPTCAAGRLVCMGGCVDPKTDPQYCGATDGCGVSSGSSGRVCTQAEHCVGSQCALICPASQLACGAACVDPKTDNQHCGAKADCFAANAGTACDPGQVCDGAGSCKPTCQTGLLVCGGRCVDPKIDRQHCGATADCANTNAGQICPDGYMCNGSGRCALSCQQNLVACNGVCIDPQTNPDYCGASMDCNGANAGSLCASDQSCSGGHCAVRCAAGQAYCGSQCIDPGSDPLHCGVGSDCKGGAACSPREVCDGTGICSLACASGFVSCGGRCVATALCPPCGQGGTCNPANLNGATCDSLGLGTGPLMCDPLTCRYDTSMCPGGGGGGGGIGGGSGH
jgi:hypothetical protein